MRKISEEEFQRRRSKALNVLDLTQRALIAEYMTRKVATSAAALIDLMRHGDDTEEMHQNFQQIIEEALQLDRAHLLVDRIS